MLCISEDSGGGGGGGGGGGATIDDSRKKNLYLPKFIFLAKTESYISIITDSMRYMLSRLP